MYVKLERFQILERRDGTIFKTKSIGFEWFPLKGKPETSSCRPDEDLMWVETGIYHFGTRETLPE